VNTVAAAAVEVVLGATKGNVFALMKAEVGDFCRQAVNGRYPFTQNSSNEITREDFATLFAPGGKSMASSRKTWRNWSDTTTSTWSFREIGAARMSDPSGALRQFQRAKVIRDTFFRTGGNQPALTLTLKPTDMDQTIQRFKPECRWPGGELRARSTERHQRAVARTRRWIAGAHRIGACGARP